MVSLEAIMIISAIEAHEERGVATIDKLITYIHMESDE